MNRRLMAVVAALVVATSPAQVIAHAWSGDTSAAPTFDRPFFDFSGLSAAGDDVRYQSLSFSVTAAGTYDLLSIASGGWDNFLLLYSPAFSPGAPLADGIIANDDLGPIGHAGFSVDLVTGVAYVAVTTGFGSTDFGAYANSIVGPGSVIVGVVPEPASAALLAIGLIGLIGRFGPTRGQAVRNPRLRTPASK